MLARSDSSMFPYRRTVKLTLASLIIVLSVTLTAFTMRVWRLKPGPTTPSTQPRQGKIDYIGGHMVWPSLREPFRVMALRLEKPGTERIIFIGSLSRLKSNPPTSLPVRLILEQPNRLRLEEGNNVTLFDGSSLSKLGSQLTDDDADEAESLLLDFPERLFVGQVLGNPMFQLGSRFRTDDGSTPNYKGPYYDIFEMAEKLSISATPSSDRDLTTKRYFINSVTHLTERIVYARRRNNRVTNVEVKLGDWRLVEKQQVPFSITRLEEGQPTLQLKVSTAALAKRANDGLFPTT